MAKGISLHVGVNEVDPGHYQGWSGPLIACEYDAVDMASLATDQGFQTTTLMTAEATRESVIAGIRAAASDLKKGDLFLLTYSGHGGQVGDYNRDEPDNMDETWCLFDGQLIDDEIFALWPDFKAGVRILVLSDSCHSGTAIKLSPGDTDPGAVVARRVAEAMTMSGTRYRYMPRDAAGRTYRANKAFYDKQQDTLPPHNEIVPQIKATVRLISGCQDNQYSLDGSFNGLFTGTLLQVWDSGHFRGNYDEFHRSILSLMPPTQSPNHLVVGQPNPEFADQKPFNIVPGD